VICLAGGSRVGTWGRCEQRHLLHAAYLGPSCNGSVRNCVGRWKLRLQSNVGLDWDEIVLNWAPSGGCCPTRKWGGRLRQGGKLGARRKLRVKWCGSCWTA